jgi:hypothetical protein
MSALDQIMRNMDSYFSKIKDSNMTKENLSELAQKWEQRSRDAPNPFAKMIYDLHVQSCRELLKDLKESKSIRG